MINSEKKQAALDAIQDILNARNAGGNFSMPSPGGEFDIDVDPALNTPSGKNPNPDDSNLEINDPDGVLQQVKQNKQNQQQSKPQETKNSQSQKNSNNQQSGSQQSGEKQDSGEQSSSSDDSDSKSSDNKSGSKSDKKSSDKSNGEARDKQEDKLKKSDEYVKDWNETIDKFDKDEVSDEDLDKALADEKNKAKKDALEAIKASRRRKLEIDPDEDKRLKMPKNSEVKSFDDSDDKGETEEERQTRIEKIKHDLSDEETIKQDLHDIDTDLAIKKGNVERANQAEKNKIARQGKLLDFQDFSGDLMKAIRSQIAVAKKPEDSFNKPNASYAGSPYLMPSQVYGDRKEKPVINVYFDQSPSWDYTDIKKGMDAIATIAGFERQKKVKINVYYFANHLHTNLGRVATGNWKDWYEGGTHGFDEVLENIVATRANNVIIMTDSDINGQTQWDNCTPVEVKGCVWFLWKRGQKSPNALRYLKGMRGTYQYNLN